MPGFINHILIVLSLVLLVFDESLATKCVSMNNKPCMVRPTLIDLNPDKLHHYSFIFCLDRWDGSCNTAENSFDRICVPN